MNTPVKEDLRVRRTRKHLWEAFVTLLNKQAFEKISVKDICETAMVHRTTFYKHFEDKFQLLSYGLDMLKQMVFDNINVENSDTTAELLVPSQLFEQIAAHPRFFSILLIEDETKSLCSILRHFAAAELKAELENTKSIPETVPIDIVANFYSGGITAILTWWVEQDMKIPAKQMAEYIDHLIPSEYFPSCFANSPNA